MRINLLYTVFLSYFAVLHPFHVSVTDIVHNAKNQSLEISQRIFIDDFEQGLKKFHKMDYINTYEPDDPIVLDSLIGVYLKEKVFFKIDGKDLSFNFLGSEVEGDARWCYFEIENVAQINEVEITNITLMEVFDDQQNIVHVKVGEELKSYKFDKDDNYITFKF